jgi:putative spermidine/putrescine transport system substrate-binding protein
MVSTKSKNVDCAYKWINWITSAKVQAQVAEYFGEAPAQTLACQHTSDKTFCQTYHALDESYSKQLHYWTTPQKQCVDGSGSNCTDYAEWVTKWQQIKG